MTEIKQQSKRMTRASEHPWVFVLMLLMTSIIWGSAFPSMKLLTESLTTGYLLGIRFTIAALILFAVFFKRIKRQFNRWHISRGLVLGVLYAGGFIFQTAGLNYTTPGKNAFLTAVYVMLVPFVYWLIDKVRPSRYNIIAAVISIAGIGLISLKAGTGFSLNLGDALTLICAAFFAAQIVFVSRYSPKSDVFVLTFWQILGMAVCSWIMALVSEQPPSLAVWTPVIVGNMLYVTLGSTLVAFLMQNIGQLHVKPTTASLVLSLEAVFGVVFSVLFGFEVLSFTMVIGLILIFLAILINETRLEFLARPPRS